MALVEWKTMNGSLTFPEHISTYFHVFCFRMHLEDVCNSMTKDEGSLIKLYKLNGKCRVSTRRTQFANCFNYLKFTYILELTGKNNQIIAKYRPDKYKFWFIAARSNDFEGKYIDINSITLHKCIQRPQLIKFNSMRESINQAEKLIDLQDGFVVCNQTTFEPMYKIKSPA